MTAIAIECFKDESSRSSIIKRTIGLHVKQELSALCSDRNGSVLLGKDPNDIINFKWEDLIEDMRMHTPTLLSILECCSTTKGYRRIEPKVVIGIITAILCKNRRDSASIVQRLISIILYLGHTSKLVSCFTTTCIDIIILDIYQTSKVVTLYVTSNNH